MAKEHRRRNRIGSAGQSNFGESSSIPFSMKTNSHPNPINCLLPLMSYRSEEKEEDDEGYDDEDEEEDEEERRRSNQFLGGRGRAAKMG